MAKNDNKFRPKGENILRSRLGLWEQARKGKLEISDINNLQEVKAHMDWLEEM